MEGSKDQRLIEVVGEAMSKPPEEREAFIRAQCPNPADQAEAMSLLDALQRAQGFMERPTLGDGAANVQPHDERAGAMLGRYKLLQQIGEGGFGIVFMAEQREPVHRRVALKIIKLGMDTKQVIARFEAERQALALMEHPNIARVLDAGATETGRPYFVMELVKGEPITTYCDQHNLTLAERLALIQQVCNAVQHAHMKGIIHRDLKPSNILVTEQDGAPVAKVIDFGIAKAVSHRLTEKTVFTEFRQFIGTPEYMSPEQAAGGQDIDTRTDIYALGVLLYELLTGATPFDARALRSAAFGEIQRIIRDVDPPKPSTKLSQSAETIAGIAAHRQTEPKKLGTMIRGELDWIVMKAMEKEPSRRYQSAIALAADILHHLSGEPVLAAPVSGGYRLRKFVHRHRTLLASVGAVFVALLAGLATTTYGLYRATQAERLARERLEQVEKARADATLAKDEAQRSEKLANAVAEFFTQDLLDLHPVPAGTPEITVRQLLDAVPTKIDRYFKSDPGTEGVIRERVGQLYRRLGDPRKAEQYLTDAVPLLEKGLGPDKRFTLSAVQRLGELHFDLRNFDKAVALFDKAYQGRLRAFGVDYSMTINSLGRRGMASVLAGRVDAGLEDLHAALRHAEEREGRDSRNFAVRNIDLIAALATAKRFEEAERASREMLATIQRVKGPLSSLEWTARCQLASICLGLGQNAEGLSQADESIRQSLEVYPPDHLLLFEPKLVRGRALLALSRLEEAVKEVESTYAMVLLAYGAENGDSRETAALRVELAERMGDAPAAELWKGRAK